MAKAAKADMTNGLKARKGVEGRGTFFPFLELPAELRIMIYKLVANFDSINEVVCELNAMNVCLPRGSTEWHYRDLAQHRTISDGIWRKIPRYSFNTPSILLVNRQVSVEAIIELKKQPLIIDSALVNAMQKFSLTIAHFIPFRALKKIEHLHFESTVDAYYVLWGGSDLTADINQGYVRRGASFPSILKAHEMSPPNRKKEK